MKDVKYMATTNKATNAKTTTTTSNHQPLWAEVKVSQWGTTINRYCKTCGERHTIKDPHAE